MRLGQDFASILDGRIVYQKTESLDDSVETGDKILTLKLDFPSVDEFKKFVNNGSDWSKDGRENEWLGKQILKVDSSLHDKGFVMQSVTYKDSIFDERPVVVIITRYKVNG